MDQRLFRPHGGRSMRFMVGICTAALCCGASLAPAQDPARAVIERAIQAHGGMERLSRNRIDRVRVRGALRVGNNIVPFTCDVLVQLPDQFKSTWQMSADARTLNIVRILNGDKSSITVNGQRQNVPPELDAEMRETLHLDRAMRLVPLLNDAAYQLTLLGPTKILDREATGIKVTTHSRKELRLYFDKDTGLLIKTEHNWKDPRTPQYEVRQEEFYSDYRDVGGYQRPVKTAIYRDGKRIFQSELLEVKYYDRIDPAEFAIP
jgi:hypothetical protein